MSACEMPEQNASQQEIRDILTTAKTIAVVGLSKNPDKDSNRVARYLLEQGYDVIPVNPTCTEALGRPCYPDLKSIPSEVGPIDLVNIFRRPEDVPPVVEQAIAMGAGCVWMQLGIAHNDAAEQARAAGLRVVMNKCTKIEHHTL